MNVSFAKKYAKGIVAVAAAVVVLGKAIADGTVDGSEFELIVAAIAGIGVVLVPNAEG